jgi:excinuclease ABC subunit C
MHRSDLQKYKLPDSPGVYIFKQKNEVVYVGKATSLKDRVRSYFSKDLLVTRGGKVATMVLDATKLEWIETDSVLEALILEANLIKKHTPVGNTRDKDNKSFNYVVVTDEDFPRILCVRGRELFAGTSAAGSLDDVRHTFGPYPDGSALREALKLVRKIFPYRDTCTPTQISPDKQSLLETEVGKKIVTPRPCFNRQIGLCPGVCDGTCSKKEYAQLVRNIVYFFSGKKKQLVRMLEKEMKLAAKNEQFEDARNIQRQLHALSHIHDVALIKKERRVSDGGGFGENTAFNGGKNRIESFDVAHISGTHTVGVMVVAEGGEVQKSEIRKFIIRTSGNDDLASLEELLTRRFKHLEWGMPACIVIDGGETHLIHARRVLARVGVAVPVVSVVKDDRHKARALLGDEMWIAKEKDTLLRLNVEAHTQAVRFHRKRRDTLRV